MNRSLKVRPAQVLTIALFLIPTLVQALTITFEDAVPANGFFVAQGYKGFQWTGLQGTNSWVLATPTDGTDVFSSHSGTNYIWSNAGSSLTMSDGIFSFNSMWARSGQSPGTDTAHGFLSGMEIYTQDFNVGQTYSQVALNFAGIDEIRFNQTSFNLVMDDINVNVPEPATLALVGLGLAGLGFSRRKQ